MDLRGFGLSADELRQLGYVVDEDKGDGEEAAPDHSSPDHPGASDLTRYIWIATLAFLTVFAWGIGSQHRLPKAVPSDAPDTTFSGERASAELGEISREPHPTGSPEHERVRTYLLERLRSLGLEPEVQTSTWFNRDADLVSAATVRNVLARVTGSASTGALLLTAHYDGVPLSPGGGDDGIGVAMVLEAVRALVAGEPLRNDVIVLFTDADELGLLGSRAFAEGHPWAKEVALVMAVEGRGAAGPSVFFERGNENGRIVETLAAAEAHPWATSLGRALRGSLLESADGDPLLHGDVPRLDFTALRGAALRHQQGDTSDRVSERTLQHGGRQLLALARRFGERDLRADLAGPNRVYLSLPWIGLLHYPASWVWPISLALVLFWTLVTLVVRARAGTTRGLLVGVTTGLAVVGVPAGLGRVLFDVVVDLHREYGTLTTAFYQDGRHVLVLAALSVTSAALAYTIGRTWARTDELLCGALAIPLVFCLWLTFLSAFVAPAVQWPMALALLSAAVVTTLGPRRSSTPGVWALLLLLSAVVIALTVPSLELVSEAWTFRAAARLGAILGLSVLFLLPMMDWLLQPKAWRTPLLGVGVAGVLVLLTLPAVQSGADHPLPTTLTYLTKGPPHARVFLGAIGANADSSGARVVSGEWLTVPGPGEQWARSWVGDPPTGAREPGILLLGVDSLYEIAGSGPDSKLAPPRVRLVESSTKRGRRRLRLAVESGLRGEMVGVHVPDGMDARITGAGDAGWDSGPTPVRSLIHWGQPETSELMIGLEIGAEVTELQLLLLEHHLRAREILGTYFLQRPDSLVANTLLGSDRVIQRTVFRLPVADSSSARSR